MTNDRDTLRDSDAAVGGDQLGEILGVLADALIAWEKTAEEITAPVDIPRREDMRIQLVPLAWVERLEEYRAERSNWHPVWGIFLGATLGILINCVTGGQMTPAAGVLVAVFLLMAGLALGSALRYQRRGDLLRDRMLARPPTPGHVGPHGDGREA